MPCPSFSILILKATGGFEPPIRVLQTLALTTWPRRQTPFKYISFRGCVKFRFVLLPMLTNFCVHAKLPPLTMQTNPLFGYFYAWYFYAGAPARVESPRQPNADG
jgi:hypothetical protein